MSRKGAPMFTKQDFEVYFQEVEESFKKAITINTDLLSQVTRSSIKNKLAVILAEDLDGFRFLRTERKKWKNTP